MVRLTCPGVYYSAMDGPLPDVSLSVCVGSSRLPGVHLRGARAGANHGTPCRLMYSTCGCLGYPTLLAAPISCTLAPTLKLNPDPPMQAANNELVRLLVAPSAERPGAAGGVAGAHAGARPDRAGLCRAWGYVRTMDILAAACR